MVHLSSCKICNSQRIIPVKKYVASPSLSSEWRMVFEDILKQKDDFRIPLNLCLRCGFVFYGRMFTAEEMRHFYEVENRFGNVEERSAKPGRIMEVRRLLRFFENTIDFSDIKTVLDVGAGDFEALDKVMERYQGVSYTAIDPSYGEGSHKGAKVIRTMLEDLEVTEQYDLVLMVHILEHVAWPNEFMQQAAALTKKWVYVEVPFQLGPGLFSGRAVNTQHINYFSPATLNGLLRRHGFVVRRLEFDKTGYLYNGMPGMIRVLAERAENTTKEVSFWGVIENIYYLVSPMIYLGTVGMNRLKSFFR